jgi:hypothetical protein
MWRPLSAASSPMNDRSVLARDPIRPSSVNTNA